MTMTCKSIASMVAIALTASLGATVLKAATAGDNPPPAVYSVPTSGTINGVDYHVTYGHKAKHTAYGLLYTDHVTTSDGQSYDTCELVFAKQHYTVEADCHTGRPQESRDTDHAATGDAW